MWTFNGSIYDLSQFAKHHPGGKYLIDETCGYDITYLIQTNHNWNKEKAISMMEKYKIYNVATLQILWDTELDEIHKELHFNIKYMKTPWYGWLYFFTIGFYYVYLVGSWVLQPTYLTGILMGTFGWLFTGFIQHEASHNSLSKYPTINYYCRFILLPWADPFQWFMRHSILHHQYTNTELDEDFQTHEGVPVRHHKDVKWNWMNQIQVILIQLYNPFLSFFYSFGKFTLIQFLWISTHYYARQNILLSVLPFLVFSYWFMFITQLNHIQESAITEKLLKAPPNFVQHQAKSCVDYNHGNIVLSCLSIFLNYQTYHHLFPRISHFHFLHLKPELDAVLKKRGIIVNNNDFINVVYSYFGYLNKLSNRNR